MFLDEVRGLTATARLRALGHVGKFAGNGLGRTLFVHLLGVVGASAHELLLFAGLCWHVRLLKKVNHTID